MISFDTDKKSVVEATRNRGSRFFPLFLLFRIERLWCQMLNNNHIAVFIDVPFQKGIV